MDRYTESYIKINVNIDAGGRVFCKGEPLQVHLIGNEKKVVLPISKILYTFKELQQAGAKCDVSTLKTLALAGAEGRWKDEIQVRRENNIPSNVYIANARSIQYAIDKGNTPPSVKWVGRKKGEITEVYDSIDEVVQALADRNFRTSFARGGKARLSK